METILYWVTLAGGIPALIAMAASAVAYVVKYFQETKQRRSAELFRLMQLIDSKELPLASKIAAVYSLREFKDHKEFVVRFCETLPANIGGSAAQPLIKELELTKKAMAGQA